ncbi:ribosomal protein S18-alanine N-acetyltransferase [Psychrobacter sp. Pi2-51]|uniref:ribosomal protein S18-alanine N-acetyltransferase n=1 Tax=Psychrobacter sp. Pi2-51 TaxID=2774132 RepID=UPI001919EC89|nr:ribosomal protein S18-alanine N-acetyltransferase [Psychrobacter sp. Pi2-51]
MFTIENIEELLIDAIEFEEVIQAVANIETMVQPQDAWGYQTIIELLAQDGINLSVVYKIDKIVGYCLYQVVFEQAEILRIGTHPDYQRQGIASQVFAKLNTELMNNKVENLLLEVRADNFSAIALYEQQGLAVIHRRKGYYQMPHRPAIDALIMQRVHL